MNMKAVIADAFAKLAAEKNIDKITVKDLVEACGISRQTFYYHFQDILEVIEWSMEQGFQRLLEKSLSAKAPEEDFLEFITASKDSERLLQKLLQSQRREQIETLLAQSVCTYLRTLVEEKGGPPEIPYEDRETALNFCTYGIVGLLLECCGKKETDRRRLAQQLLRLRGRPLNRQEQIDKKEDV